MRLIAVFFALTFGLFASSQINIIPEPVSLNEISGEFSFTSSTKIIYQNPDLLPSANFLHDYISKYYKLNLKVSSGPSSPASIILSLNSGNKTIDANKLPSYSLSIQPKSFVLAGTNPEAVFNGIQTIIQLLPLKTGALKIPCVEIQDKPRFQYRGLHLDVGRHFMPVDFIKKYIDFIALHKMNYFHWHLTEDQGWRIEIKKYPKLTEAGAWRNGTIIGHYPGLGNDNIKDGGFYTQEQVKEIVKYAADRYITVIPEIEMPGHSSAAIAAYPFLSCFPEEPTKIPANMISKASALSKGKLVQETWGVHEDVFCAGKEETFKFLQDVVDEIVALFPSTYFHVGGDECPKANWKRCPKCQQRIKDNNLKDEHELQSYFIQRMEKYLNSKGKILIGWDEILEGGLAPKAVVMSWRGEAGGIEAAKQKHDVIMTPGGYVYLDHSQSENEDSVTIGGYTSVEKIYSYEPIPAALNEEQAQYVLGAQGNVWTEYMSNPRKVEYMILPRLSALSEVLWSPKEKRNWSAFEKKLPAQFKRYELWKANYSKAYFDLKATILPEQNSNGLLWKLETKLPSSEIKYIIHKAGSPYELTFAEATPYTSPIEIKNTEIIAAINTLNGRSVSNPVSQTFIINKATGKKIKLAKEPSKSYPGDGAFTLVNGVQNEKGLTRSKEFIAYNGDDCEATIDMGNEQSFSTVIIHSFHQKSSWIWWPLSMEVLLSADGKNFSTAGLTDDFKESKSGNGTMSVVLPKASNARFIKIVVKNRGDIPEGEAGAGNKAWLFVDEIEIK